jgi:hypothetical protein
MRLNMAEALGESFSGAALRLDVNVGEMGEPQRPLTISRGSG